MIATVIGRGHSGTRAMSHTLSASGVYMGNELNVSGDLVPAQEMYDACRIFARHVRHTGDQNWDFSSVNDMEIDSEFIDLVNSYLSSVLTSDESLRGWKLPETILCFPWIVRMFPDIKYIYWVRDPRDCIVGRHNTDDLARFGVPHESTDDIRLCRATSWKYQSEIYRATPRPKHLIEVRFEDLVLDQDRTLARIGEFLGIPMVKIEVRPESIGRWKSDEDTHDFEFLAEELRTFGYA